MSDGADLPHLIDSLISQIERVRSELNRPDTDTATGIARTKVPVETVQHLKASVDHLRLFLWAYLDARSPDSTESRLRLIRMSCAADMLGQLANDFLAAGLPHSPELTRLREQVRAITPLIVDARRSPVQ